MANSPLTSDTSQIMPAEDTLGVGRPTQQLEIEDSGVAEEEINFPTGPKLWLTVASLCMALFLKGLVSSLTVNFEAQSATDHISGPHNRCSRST